MARYLMQAADSVDGQIYTWTAASPDYVGSGYPGGGTATDIVVAARPAEAATPNGTNGQILTSDGSGNFGTPITPPSGDLVGTTATQDLENKTLVSPNLSGTPEYPCIGGSPNVARGKIKSVVGVVETSSMSTTTVASYTMLDETLCAFDVIVTYARKSAVTKGGRYKRSVVYLRTGGGAPTIVGSLESGTDQETTSGDDVTIDVDGNTVRVRVTAADSDARNWICEMRIQETWATA